MAKQIAALFCATAMLMGTSAMADENNHDFTFSLNGDLKESWVPTTAYTVDRNANTEAKTDDNITLYGFSADAAYRLSEDNFLSGSFLGNRPSIGISILHLTGESKAKDFYAVSGVNSVLGIDGATPNTFWAAGTWTSENDVKLSDVSLTLSGTENAKTWSFIPEFGLSFRRHDLEYKASRKGAVTGNYFEVVNGGLDTNMYGGTLGLNVLSPVSDGWRFGVRAGVTAMVTSTDMSLTQDANSALPTIPDVSVKDNDNSGFYEGSLSLSVEKTFGAVSISSEVYGNANYGLPYIDGTSQAGVATKIANDKTAYDLGGRLSLNIKF
ncbi:hypothetical protein GUA87_10150 [Sneathiella sp. P13V-1]|uniref:hypothetical protein n=1 Tax=Sneathiella sp. P13V-1 TaxID=2697366 RepID=UPI00187B22D3|nr:hypothetical protein [Sneathiella sp. P13V-1]MBE7637206.1 hypothetical protein [Sneathiella sp. P13V-1]